ncbi:hypothetical protein EJB05_30510, partial [Eragrostis curvula]
MDHLMVGCAYSRETWFRILRPLGLQRLSPAHDDTFVEWWLRSQKRVAKNGRGAFDSMTILVAWKLWKERNNWVFDVRVSHPPALAKAMANILTDRLAAATILLVFVGTPSSAVAGCYKYDLC